MTGGRIGMAGVQATVTNLSQDNATDGTSIQGSDAARLMVSIQGKLAVLF